MNKKNVELVWAVPCANLTIDSLTNSMTLFNVVEEINVDFSRIDKPTEALESFKNDGVPLKLSLVTYWKNRTSDKNITFKAKAALIDPSGNILIEIPFVLDGFTEKSVNLRFYINFNGIKINGEGEHIFKVFVKQNDNSEFEEVGHSYIDVHYRNM